MERLYWHLGGASCLGIVYYAEHAASETEISPMSLEMDLSIGSLESALLLLFFVVRVSLIGAPFPLCLPLYST